MKVLRLPSLILVAIMISRGAPSACVPMGPPPYFDPPSYLDPDYQASRYAEWKYGQKKMFKILLSQYADLRPRQASANVDIDAMVVSKELEPAMYVMYQQGATYFRHDDYRSALAVFSELQRTAVPLKTWQAAAFGRESYSWVKEASTYMVARCQLIMSQERWDGYSYWQDEIDQGLLSAADSSYLRYIEEYPTGLYAESARNIRRKIFVMAGKHDLLDQAIKQNLLRHFPVADSLDRDRFVDINIVEEFFTHFHGTIDFAHDAPVLLAYAWLGEQMPDSADLAILETREKDFSAYPGLFTYVRALGLYRSGRYQELLDGTSKTQIVDTVIFLSTQLLRARALERTGDYESALTIFTEMHKVSPEDQLDVEIASMALKKANGLWLYSESSPVTDLSNLRSFALFGLSDSELVAGLSAAEITGDKRRILLLEIAKRYLLTGRYKELDVLHKKERIQALFPLEHLVQSLAEDPLNPEALIGLGKYLLEKQIQPRSYLGSDEGWDNRLANLVDCKPCRNFSERIAPYTSPMTLFVSAAEVLKKTGKRSELEAEALHHIVMGGRSGPWMNRYAWRYGGDETVFARSVAAFTRLHRRYKDSPWTVKTPYYYR